MSDPAGNRSLSAVRSAPVERLRGDDARNTNIAAGKALAETIRTTLGPKGMDKMLVGASGTVVITNDGASILDRMDIEHPAAEMIVEVAASQGTKAGDGTTTAVLLTGELLKQAEQLLENGLHPSSVTKGYRRASQKAFDELDAMSLDISLADESGLRDVAATSVTGKWDADAAEVFADLAVGAIRAIEDGGMVDLSKVTLRPVAGAGITHSSLVSGIAIDIGSSSTSIEGKTLDIPRRIEGAQLALIDTELTVDEANAVENVTVDSPETMEALRRFEHDAYAAQVREIIDAGADVVVCQKSIDDAFRNQLAREGILAIERTRQDELYKLADVTGGKLVTSVDELSPVEIGYADEVERRTIAGTHLLIVTEDANSQHVSVLLRGGTQHVVDEMKRIIEDCLYVTTLAIEDSDVLPGGGATEIHLAKELREYADSLDSREQLAVHAFADALEAIPRTLATTAGLDPIDTLVELRANHHDGKQNVGLDVTNGRPKNMLTNGVLEPAAVKRHAIANAEEAANMLLRIDDVIAATRDADESDHEHDHGHTTHEHGSGGYPWAIGH
ncbi:thermosome subunit alpha [Haladaptatus sp. NG-SE-30]